MTRVLLVMLLLLMVLPGAVAEPRGDEAGSLVMGVFPRRNFTETLRMFTPMAEHLGRELGREVRLETTRDFDSFWDNVSSGQYDLVHFNQYHYLKSHRDHGYGVILKNEEFGKSTIAGALVVRKDSGLTSVQDLKGRKIVFGGDRKAMLGYVMASAMLRNAGLEDDDYTGSFALNPPNACMATYFGLAAAGGVGDVVLDLPIVKGKIKTDEMTYLAVSEPVAHLPWAVRGGLPRELEQAITAALLGLNDTDAGAEILGQAKLTGLVPAGDAEYDTLRGYIRDVLGEEF